MKEHTVFALVFLVLVVGFVVFGSGGSTGKLYMDTYKMVDGVRVDLGTSEVTRWKGADNKNQLGLTQSIVTSSVRPDTNKIYLDSSSYFAPSSGKSITATNLGAFGSNARKYQIYENQGMDMSTLADYTLSELKQCITRIIFTGDTSPSIADAEITLKRSGQLYSCPTPEQLDGDGDGYITRNDASFFGAVYYGFEADITQRKYAGYIQCLIGDAGYLLNLKTNEASRENMFLTMNGGKVKCVSVGSFKNTPFRLSSKDGVFVPVN